MSVSADPQIVHDPVFRHRLRFTDTTDAHGAPAVLCEMWVEPGGGVPPHVHPRMEERFTVVEGRMEFLAGRRWVGAETESVLFQEQNGCNKRRSFVSINKCVILSDANRIYGCQLNTDG